MTKSKASGGKSGLTTPRSAAEILADTAAVNANASSAPEQQAGTTTTSSSSTSTDDLTAEQYLSLGDTYYVDESYEQAIDAFAASLTLLQETTTTTANDAAVPLLHFRILSHRSAAFYQLERYQDALEDAQAAFCLSTSETPVAGLRPGESEVCARRKGLAALKLMQYQHAKEAFETALQLAALNKKNTKSYEKWIAECNSGIKSAAAVEVPAVVRARSASIELDTTTAPSSSGKVTSAVSPAGASIASSGAVIGSSSSMSSEASDPADAKPASKSTVHVVIPKAPTAAAVAAPVPAAVAQPAAAATARAPPQPAPAVATHNARGRPTMPKYQYYQSDKYMTVSILEPNVRDEDLTVLFEPKRLTVLLSKWGEEFTVVAGPLYDSIDVPNCQVKFKDEKVLIKLRKTKQFEWFELMGKEPVIKDPPPMPGTDVPTLDATKARPYASHRDWDAIEKNVKAEEDNEKPEGDEAMNKLFKQIYAGASEETRRAMVKSYQTSGGTVLSTNWDEVGTTDYEQERTAPKGMEWKSWEGDKLEQKDS